MSSADTPSTPEGHCKAYIVARNRHIVPKERRVERLPSGYSVGESRNGSQGCYWYVVASLELVHTKKH